MVESKLIKIKLKILSRTEKINILVPGDRLEKLIPSSNVTPPIFSLPAKLPMIVKPNLYLFKGSSDNVTGPRSAVQTCSHNISSGLDGYALETKCEGVADFNQGVRSYAATHATLVEGGEYQSNDEKIQLGGYLLNGIEYTDKIISSNWELSTENKFLPNNSVFDMVNFVNSVQFKINENVLNFILANNNLYNFFIDSNYIHPLTLKSKLTKAEGLDLEKFYSQRFIEQNILGLATLYSEVPSFYLPVRLDYRGRLYCIVEYLNYQNIELAKSLLEFSVGEKIYINEPNSAFVQDAINYLKIFGANCYGNKLEKKSFKDRIG
jgi:hypothetical protein